MKLRKTFFFCQFAPADEDNTSEGNLRNGTLGILTSGNTRGQLKGRNDAPNDWKDFPKTRIELQNDREKLSERL